MSLHRHPFGRTSALAPPVCLVSLGLALLLDLLEVHR